MLPPFGISHNRHVGGCIEFWPVFGVAF